MKKNDYEWIGYARITAIITVVADISVQEVPGQKGQR